MPPPPDVSPAAHACRTVFSSSTSYKNDTTTAWKSFPFPGNGERHCVGETPKMQAFQVEMIVDRHYSAVAVLAIASAVMCALSLPTSAAEHKARATALASALSAQPGTL